ncbi:extracellular solute-binding protein, partial [Clostridium sp.]|uniref:extracellular solute-binding protein n=1 Tax=Clostridium sp. TaxID=1506 RepID=UPI003FD7523A
MKSKRIRSICVGLSTIVLFTSLVGCSGKKAETSNNAKRTQLKVEIFDRGGSKPGQQPIDNNDTTRYIQKNFGDKNNIDMKFVTVPRDKEVDQLNILMASGDAPDIIYTYDTDVFYKYAKQGGLTDLSELLPKYGPNLVKYLGKDVVNYGKVGGKQFSIPSKRILVGNQSSVIRKDWLDKVGLPVPKTTQEFYTALKTFKEKDPGKVGDKIVPYVIDQFGYQMLADTFITKMTKEESYVYDTGANRPNPLRPGAIEGYRYLNKLFNENLISLNFVLDKDGTIAKQNLVNGDDGSFTTNNGGGMDMLDQLKTSVPAAQYVAMDAFKNYEGKTVKGLNTPIGYNIMIPKNSKVAPEAIKYLDWMTQPKVMLYLQNGIENIDYKMKDGIPSAIINKDITKLTYGGGNRNDWSLIANGKDLGNKDKDIKAMANSFPGYEKLFIDEYKDSITDGVAGIKFDNPILADGTYGTALNQKWTDMVVKMISCKPADLDKTFSQAKQVYLANGGQQIMDERKTAYQAMK